MPRRNFTLYNSADILRYLYGKHYGDPVDNDRKTDIVILKGAKKTLVCSVQGQGALPASDS